MTFSSARAFRAWPLTTQVLGRFWKFLVKRRPKWRLNEVILADDVISSETPAAPDFSTPEIPCGISHSSLLNSGFTSFWGTHPGCRAAMRENAHGIRTKTLRRRRSAVVARVSALVGVFSRLSVSITQQPYDGCVKIHSGKRRNWTRIFRPEIRANNGAVSCRAWRSDGRAATPCGGRHCDGRCPSGRRE